MSGVYLVSSEITEIVVEAGDSLDKLAHRVYGNVGNFRDIAAANDLNIFEALPIGEKIDIPSLNEVSAAIERGVLSVNERIAALSLSGLKQPSAAAATQLISWVL